MYEFKLPDLGEGIHEGEILKWYVQQGDTIKEDEPLVDVETDNAAVTIPSPVSGQIVTLGGKVGDIVTVGQVIVVIKDSAAPKQETAPPAVETAPPPPVSVTKRPVPATPATRRLARELGVDLHQVTPTGPAGRVTAEDVRQLAEQEAPTTPAPATPAPTEKLSAPRAPATPEAEFAAHAASAIPLLDLEPLPDFSQWGPVEREPLRSIRRKVAHKMVTAKTLVPHVAHMDEADVTLLEQFRKKERQRHEGQPGGHLTLLAFVVKAVTAGLRATPAFNASLDPFSADRKSIMQISADIASVALRARDGALDAQDMRGGTFTITNVGPLGGTALIPAINYPEVAILGMGRVQEKPVVRDGEIVVREMLPLTLAFDHRIADGADAARFVSELVRQLSDPNLLLLET
jgi:pyruvate dehydrogenase E2 component (dihydrolipoamide acetyltransferase)